jgi:thioredoxin 1
MKLKYKNTYFTKSLLISILIAIFTSLLYAEEPSAVKADAALPMLLDFGAKECIPCKKMAPILVELEKEYKEILTVKFIDVWQTQNVSKAKKYNINSIPTQIFLDENGKELWRHVGFISKEDILNKWKTLGYDFNTSKGEK